MLRTSAALAAMVSGEEVVGGQDARAPDAVVATVAPRDTYSDGK